MFALKLEVSRTESDSAQRSGSSTVSTSPQVQHEALGGKGESLLTLEQVALPSSTQRQVHTAATPPLTDDAQSVDSPNDPIASDRADFFDEVAFESGNPKGGSVVVTRGRLQLYRHKERTNAPTITTTGSSTATTTTGVSSTGAPTRSTMLCMLAVPMHMHYSELIDFLAPIIGTLVHLRTVRDQAPNRYMALMLFDCEDTAEQALNAFNGIRFNSLEPEVCHLAYISSISVVSARSGSARHDYLAVPSSLAELPTCPVCLERLDESATGIMTTLCDHSFHCSCLSRWGDGSCPVCRYCQAPDEQTECMEAGCTRAESLWICLICANIGCGRYVDGHAYHHFLDTQHCYAMEMETNRVWDYAADGYVHRLIQTKTGGGFVALASNPKGASEYGDADEKVDAIQLEYTYLLTSQLESQRQYFMEMVSKAEEHGRMMEEQCNDAQRRVSELEQTLAEAVKKERAADQRARTAQQKQISLLRELVTEREFNSSLTNNQSGWAKKLESSAREHGEALKTSEARIAELEEQVRDLMFFLDTQKQIASASPESVREMQGATIVEVAPAPPPTPPPSTARAKGKGRARRK